MWCLFDQDYDGLAQATTLRLFRYTQDALNAATGKMIGPSGEFTAPANGSFNLPMPPQSFALLSESPNEGKSHSQLWPPSF